MDVEAFLQWGHHAADELFLRISGDEFGKRWRWSGAHYAKTSECRLDNLDGNRRVLRLFGQDLPMAEAIEPFTAAHFLSRLRRDLRFSKWTGMVGRIISLKIMKKSFFSSPFAWTAIDFFRSGRRSVLVWRGPTRTA